MKKNSILPVLATVTLLLAIGIVVACTKENTNKEAAATEAPRSTTKLSTQQMLANELYNVWHKSDSAYRANPTVFLSVCSEEDYDDFYELANITKQQLEIIDSLLDKIPAPILTPGDGSSVPPTCIPCVTSLTTYGQNIAEIRSVINELKIYEATDTIPCFTPYIDSCIIHCDYMLRYTNSYSDENVVWCLLNCSLRRELNSMAAALAAIKVDD